MTPRLSVLFVAVHGGAYAALEPLEAAFGAGGACFLLDGPAREARRRSGRHYWDLGRVRETCGGLEQFLRQKGFRAIISGTSDGLPAGNLEELARNASSRASLPIFVVEDFPGNYRHNSSTRLHMLFIEDESTMRVHVKNGVAPSRMRCAGSPRYDALVGMDRAGLRARARARWDLGGSPVVLWAGQPEESRSLEAFTRLTPYLADSEATLLFKAHPRDRLYEKGRYARLLAAFPYAVDVSHELDTLSLCCAADLVVTQFSSVGVEAGYLGTPTLFALFQDLGRSYLQVCKGYSDLPWVAKGAAFLLESVSQARVRCEEALFDQKRRRQVLSNFHRHFQSRHPSAGVIADTILQALDGKVPAQTGEC